MCQVSEVECACIQFPRAKITASAKVAFFFFLHIFSLSGTTLHIGDLNSLTFFLSCMIVPCNLHSLTGSYAPN